METVVPNLGVKSHSGSPYRLKGSQEMADMRCRYLINYLSELI